MRSATAKLPLAVTGNWGAANDKLQKAIDRVYFMVTGSHNIDSSGKHPVAVPYADKDGHWHISVMNPTLCADKFVDYLIPMVMEDH